MTMQSVGLMAWPTRQFNPASGSSALSTSTLTFDSTADRLAYVGRSPLADSISKVFFRTGTVTTGDTVKIRIETVTNGRPSGTLVAAGAEGTVSIADSDDNVWKSVTIGTPYTHAVGEEFAIVMTHDSGATPNWQMSCMSYDWDGFVSGNYPLILQDTGTGAWNTSSQRSNFEMVVEMTNAGGAVTLPGLLPLNGAGTIVTGFNTGSSPNERALKFVAPMKMRAIAAVVPLWNVAAGADLKVCLWDATDNPGASPTPLAEANTLDGDFAFSTTSDGLVTLYFTSPVTLTAGTTYYLGIRPTTANSISVAEASAGGTGASATGIRAFGLDGVTAHLSTRTWSGNDPGAWADTSTTLPLMSLLIDQLDDGASAGGGGGMRMAGHGGLAA